MSAMKAKEEQMESNTSALGPFIAHGEELLLEAEEVVKLLRSAADRLYSLREDVPEQVVDARLDIMSALAALKPAVQRCRK